MTRRYVGSPVKVLDSPRLLTGRGKYVDDLTFPRMVHVAFVRSPHAHARITRLDVEPARKAAGVVAVMTGEEAARLCKATTQLAAPAPSSATRQCHPPGSGVWGSTSPAVPA